MVRFEVIQYFFHSRNRTLSLSFLTFYFQTTEPSEMLKQKREKWAFDVVIKSQESKGEATPWLDISTSEIVMKSEARFDSPTISYDNVLCAGGQESPEISMKTANQVNVDDKEKSLDSEDLRYTLSVNQVSPAANIPLQNLRDNALATFLKADKEGLEDAVPSNLSKKGRHYTNEEMQLLLNKYGCFGNDWDTIKKFFPGRSAASVSKLGIL